MKRITLFLLLIFPLTIVAAQTSSDEDLTPEEKYLKTMLNPQGSGAGISMEYSVTGSAELDYGTALPDDEDDYAQGFLTTIDSSLDLSFTFNPDQFSASPRQSYLKRGVYAEIILTDFGIRIANDAGIDFWDNYTIYDSDGNAYLPDQESDNDVVLDEADTEDEVTYDDTILYTGLEVTEPSVEANIHLSPEVYFQIASQPEIDYNMATTLGGQGEWAGADTENTGGLSFILDYPLFDFQASVVSQYYYTEDDLTQDDEFAASLSASYETSDYSTIEAYGAVINFFDSELDGDDDFYIITERSGSSAEALILGGASWTYNFFELVEFGIYGDVGYVMGGEFNYGYTDDYDEDDDLDSADGAYYSDFEGFLYDVRVDCPIPFAGSKGVVTFSADTYGYTYRDDIYEDIYDELSSSYDYDEIVDEETLSLDLQLAVSYTEERWQVQTALQGFNILDYSNSLENYLLDDHQELGITFTGQYTFGNPSRLAVTPSVTLDYSTGRLMTEGWFWDTSDEWDGSDDYDDEDNGYDETDLYTSVYEDSWYDDVLSLQASLAFEFPQTVITLTYTSLQLIPGQVDTSEGDDYDSIDLGTIVLSTVISY
ncbi:MAG: hypothetical protein PQJ59_16295 [Spirochaetales bacterium]|nr:hypothetical protein [Spirochaetales bacterium]